MISTTIISYTLINNKMLLCCKIYLTERLLYLIIIFQKNINLIKNRDIYLGYKMLYLEIFVLDNSNSNLLLEKIMTVSWEIQIP